MKKSPSFRPFSYDLIVADPPWAFELRSEKGEEKSPQKHYDCMSTSEIKALAIDGVKIGDLARKDATLFLWATGAMLPDALEVMAAWGFTYCSQMIWRKVTKNAKPAMGTGYIVRTLHEPILVGKMGDGPGRPQLPSLFDAVFDGERREHSRKPEAFYDLILEKFPKSFRLDLFGGARREGFDRWVIPHRASDR